jgi:hypothetical protein
MKVLFLNPPFHPRLSCEQRNPAVVQKAILSTIPNGSAMPLEFP